jgi:hypothetical protein
MGLRILSDCVDHQLLVISKEHFDIRLVHDISQKLYALRMSVYDISENEEGVFRGEAYLAQN